MTNKKIYLTGKKCRIKINKESFKNNDQYLQLHFDQNLYSSHVMKVSLKMMSIHIQIFRHNHKKFFVLKHLE